MRLCCLNRVAGLFLAGIITFVLAGRVAAADQEGFGPFPVRNFQPIQLLFLGMFADRAAVVKKGVLEIRQELAETSTIFNEQSARANATMKLETLRSGLFLRYGLTDRLEVGIEVPALYRYRGFLEGAITATERATTGLNPARSALKNTGFVYNLTRDGRTLFSGGDGDLGLGDITLIGKYQMLSQGRENPAVSLRLAVKVPSGDDRRFFGSGHADVGGGLAVEKALAGRWVLYGNLNGVFPTGQVAGLTLQPAVSGVAAVEYLWSPAVSFVAQFDYYSSPFHGTGTRVLDRGVTEATAGFNYRLRPNLLWQVYGVENLDFIRDSAADFTLSTVVTYRFGT
ncbi:MAG TPA: DUF3187 family protein [Nitrospiraceae bacterium]|nr:DUF3187 family protein [Nitrospiraceae bacterium]